MTVLETSWMTGSGSDKSNKHYKHTVDEALPVVLDFDDERNYSDLSV